MCRTKWLLWKHLLQQMPHQQVVLHICQQNNQQNNAAALLMPFYCIAST